MKIWVQLLILVVICSGSATGWAQSKAKKNGERRAAQNAAAVDSTTTQDAETTSVPIAPAPPPAPRCFPVCRDGFVCYQGACVSICNPPCGPGYECTADATCSPTVQASSVQTLGVQTQYVDPSAAYREQKRQIKQERRAARMAYREVPRFLVSINTGMLGFGEQFDLGMFAYPALGFKKNMTSFMGLQVRVGGMFGFFMVADEDYYGDSDEKDTGFGAFAADAGIYFGPLGRFYIGPIGWVSYFSPSEESVELNDGTFVSNPSGVFGGAGLDMGFLLGKRDQIDLGCRIESALTTELPMLFSCGFAYHIMAP